MGMFDDVRCDWPLVNPEHNARSFQTKSLDRDMKSYTITREGRLIEHLKDWNTVPPEERPYWGTPEWPTLAWVGAMVARDAGTRDLDYHGVLVMTADAQPDLPATDRREWIEYTLTFTHGTVESMALSQRYYHRPTLTPTTVTP